MSNSTVLVVDDEADIRQLLRIFFERQGFRVLLANDGVSAITTAQHYSPDLILMDIQMPFKTGIEAVSDLRADMRFTKTPIIALTAYARVQVAADLIRAGFDEALYKPIDFPALQHTVGALLRRVK